MHELLFCQNVPNCLQNNFFLCKIETQRIFSTQYCRHCVQKALDLTISAKNRNEMSEKKWDFQI